MCLVVDTFFSPGSFGILKIGNVEFGDERCVVFVVEVEMD